MEIQEDFNNELHNLCQKIRENDLMIDADKMDRIEELQRNRSDLYAFFKLGRKTAIPNGWVLVPTDSSLDMKLPFKVMMNLKEVN